MIAPPTPSSTVVLASVGDPTSTRTVYSIILLLVALGFAMVLVTAWLVRRTRSDPQVLAPLEKMGERSWREVPDLQWQRRVLDELRPPGAEPLQHAAPPPVTDEEFERPAPHPGFADISGDVERPAETVASADAPPEVDPEPPVEPEPEVAGPEPAVGPEPEVEPEPAVESEIAEVEPEVAEVEPEIVEPEPEPDQPDAPRSVASPHGHAGPGRDDRPLP